MTNSDTDSSISVEQYDPEDNLNFYGSPVAKSQGEMDIDDNVAGPFGVVQSVIQQTAVRNPRNVVSLFNVSLGDMALYLVSVAAEAFFFVTVLQMQKYLQ